MTSFDIERCLIETLTSEFSFRNNCPHDRKFFVSKSSLSAFNLNNFFADTVEICLNLLSDSLKLVDIFCSSKLLHCRRDLFELFLMLSKSLHDYEK